MTTSTTASKPPTPTPARHRRPGALRLMTAAVCLTTALALSACGPLGGASGSSNSSTSSPGGNAVAKRTDKGTPAPSASAPASSGTGVRTKDPKDPEKTQAASPSPSPTTSPTWSAPSIKFYNEDTSIWYQDDGVVNLDAIDSSGNLEGYRTNSGQCIGYVSREASERVWSLRGDDAMLSSVLIKREQDVFSDYSAQGVVGADYVRDDGGTMPGYELAFTTNMKYDDGSTEAMEGYRFARTVGDSGFQFEVMLLCRAGHNLTVDQWHTVLAGLRLEGIDAKEM
ncbi:hypothetical protein J5X07_05730 [Actinomyces bowdenii]|uniref:hypothetical protein n=1 Tax=Actinomyces bowdenii TaxID=131109 RepID=UPI001ABC1A3A|nr:hypothetical protein [Actinomyces bowdenii]MBO3724531.1 hypothetical protein [Actinomyces bowdenii]